MKFPLFSMPPDNNSPSFTCMRDSFEVYAFPQFEQNKNDFPSNLSFMGVHKSNKVSP
jgi:hypothetical protein